MNRFRFSEFMLDCINKDADRKYQEKLIMKGDSWRDMTVTGMYNIMMQEVSELSQALQGEYDSKEVYQECLDVINTAKMLGARIDEEKENKE